MPIHKFYLWNTSYWIYTLVSLKWDDISVPYRDRQGWTQFNSM